jgi:hypothetical protein
MDSLGLELGPYGLLDLCKSYIYNQKNSDVYEALKFHWKCNFINCIPILWKDLFNGRSVMGVGSFFGGKCGAHIVCVKELPFLKWGICLVLILSTISAFYQ